MKMFLLGMVAMYFLLNVIIIMSLVPLKGSLRKSTKQDRKKVFKIIAEILFFGVVLTILESLNY